MGFASAKTLNLNVAGLGNINLSSAKAGGIVRLFDFVGDITNDNFSGITVGADGYIDIFSLSIGPLGIAIPYFDGNVFISQTIANSSWYLDPTGIFLSFGIGDEDVSIDLRLPIRQGIKTLK